MRTRPRCSRSSSPSCNAGARSRRPRRSSAGRRRRAATAAPRRAGHGRSRRPRTAAWSCCSSRTAPTASRGSVRPAGGSAARAAPARSTGRAWSRTTPGSTSPATRPSPTAARSGPSAGGRTSSRSKASARCSATRRLKPEAPGLSFRDRSEGLSPGHVPNGHLSPADPNLVSGSRNGAGNPTCPVYGQVRGTVPRTWPKQTCRGATAVLVQEYSPAMASLARTILEEHLERGELVPGQEVALRVDQTLAQDATGTMACMQFELFGVDRVQVETAVVYVDHNILQIDFKNPDDHRFLQAMAAKYGAWFSRPGNGICHYLHCERFATPGKTLVGADSHTTQSGSCGMVAIGAGGLDAAVCMAGHPFELPCPKIVGVFLENELARPWIQAKDVILELLRRLGVRGGRGSVFEFTGPGVATLSYTERGTIANMIAELGATGAVFPSDGQTKERLGEQQRGEDFVEMPTGEAGDFDEEEHIA